MSGPGTPSRVHRTVRDLPPGAFAQVMATGIVSVGLRQHRHVALSVALLLVCVAAFGLLAVLTVWRLVAYPAAVRRDLRRPTRAFGFFTLVAGTDVLGVRLAMDGHTGTALVLLAGSVSVWVVLAYVVPATAVLGAHRQPVLAEADGSWFVWVVAGQSVAVAAATLEPASGGLRDVLASVAVLAWSTGVFLYAAVGVVVSARLLLFHLGPEDLTPSYWVGMGASAISVLAGARMVEMSPSPMIDATRELVAGVAVVLWAFATWLLPALLAVGWWRHVVHRVPLVYESGLWNIVFPLGMYSVATTYLSQADRLPLVGVVGAVGIWVAFAAWAATFTGMLTHLLRALRRREHAGT